MIRKNSPWQILPWAVFVFLSSYLSGQTILNGRILDSKSETPLQYASVSVVDSQADSIVTGGITDENGGFLISMAFNQPYYLEFEFIGFSPTRSSVFTPDESKNRKTLGVVFLDPVPLDLDAIDVEADAPMVVAGTNMTTYDADQLLSSTGGTCCDVMERIPSVDVDADGQVSLRGSPDVVILLNGKRAGILGGERRTNIMSVPVPAAMVERVEVITNPSAKQDADGMTGIINIVLKENSVSGYNGHVNANAGTTDKFNGGAYLNYRRDGSSYYMNLSLEDLNTNGNRNRNSTLVASNGDNVVNLVRQESLQHHNLTGFTSGGTRLAISENTTILGEAKFIPFERTNNKYISINDNEFSISTVDKGYLGLVDAGFRSDWNEQFQLKGNGSYENQKTEKNEIRHSGVFPVSGEMKLNRTILTLDSEYWATPSIKLESGLKERILTHSRDKSIDGNVSDFSFQERIRAAYINMEYTTFMEDMFFTGGLRFENAETRAESTIDSGFVSVSGIPEHIAALQDDRDKNQWNTYPSFSVRYAPNPLTSLRLGYSRRINRVTYDMMDPLPKNQLDLSVMHVGNMSLEPELVHSYELKVNRTFPAWNFEGVLFTQQIENVIREDDDFVNGSSIITMKNAGTGSNAGLEGRIRFTPFTFWDVTLTGLYFQTTTTTTEEDLSGTFSGFQGKISQVFDLPWKGKFEIDNRLYSTEKIPNGHINPDGLFTMNMSYLKSFLDDRVELSIKLLDVFDNEEKVMNTSEKVLYLPDTWGQYDVSSYSKPDQRTLFINLRYKFGSTNIGRTGQNGSESGGYKY